MHMCMQSAHLSGNAVYVLGNAREVNLSMCLLDMPRRLLYINV